MSTRQPHTAHEYRQLAVLARRDPRTVKAAYEGRTSEMVADGVRDAAARLGFTPPPPSEEIDG
jgi:hypothetical protein